MLFLLLVKATEKSNSDSAPHGREQKQHSEVFYPVIPTPPWTIWPVEPVLANKMFFYQIVNIDKYK